MNSKLFLASLCVATVARLGFAAETATVRFSLDADKPGAVINRNVYGQFAEHLGRCIYEGIWVGEQSPIPNTRGYRNDVVAALKTLQVPLLRWPGGCFADEYHWKDGIGPRESRPAMINTHWGGVVENNHFGTHEFLDFCELIGAEPFVCLNVGSGTVQEAMEWVEYMTSDAQSPMANLRRKNGREKSWRVRYVAVGNESWGCGGTMRPEFYADNFRRYNTFIKNYSPDYRIYRVACGPNGDNYAWTETLMKEAARWMNGLALHNYTLPTGNWQKKGSSTQFSEDEYFSTLRNAVRMDELITKHLAIMDQADPRKRVDLVVDEWGVWTDVEPGTNRGFLYQQDTLRNAIVAALHLHIFQKHAARVSMANIAQMINVLQAMILTEKEKMLLTPTYHVFEMFKVHQGATSLPVEVSSPDYARAAQKLAAVSVSASRDAAGKIHVSLVNADPSRDFQVSAQLSGVRANRATGRILTAAAVAAHNTFAAPDTVKPVAFTAATISGEKLDLMLPAKSIVMVELN
ncbi:MAG: alpha-N-arabinofuranosidase [Opitutaceae bacterium]|nr:alpha-N-arabinofuranosidase [Opitutaceae bacterium]